MIRICRARLRSSLPDATSYEGGKTRMQAASAFCTRSIHVFVSSMEQSA